MKGQKILAAPPATPHRWHQRKPSRREAATIKLPLGNKLGELIQAIPFALLTEFCPKEAVISKIAQTDNHDYLKSSGGNF
jgi:hypothetical protein